MLGLVYLVLDHIGRVQTARDVYAFIVGPARKIFPAASPYMPLVLFGLALVFFEKERRKRSPIPKKSDLESAAESLMMDTGVEVGLTFEKAEVEISPDNAPLAFKCKLRVYWTNDCEESIHLGVPLLRGIAIQGEKLTYSYQRGQWLENPQRPWGDEVKELDVLPGRRCRIWLGLDPSLRDRALKLLNDGELGLLIIPVTISNRIVDVCLRPRDRDLQQFNALEHNALKKAVYNAHINKSQAAKALLAFVCIRRIVSVAQIGEHFQQYKIPDPQKTLSDLRNDSVPFLALGANGIQLTSVLEKVILETVRADEAEFRQMFAKMTSAAIGERINNEPGFEGRINALGARPPL